MRTHPATVPGIRADKAMTASRSGGWAIAAALLLGACWFPKDRGQRLEERVERVEGESAVRVPSGNRGAAEEQSRRVDAKVDAKMAEVQIKLNELNAAVQRESAAQREGTERSAGNDKVAEEVSRLRAMLEGYAHRLDAVEKTVAQLHSSASASASTGARVPERKGAIAPEAPRQREAPAAPKGKTGVLALARQQEVNGEKGVARDLYQEFVDKFPADPNAAQAHFRLGELWFGEKRWRDAVLEYGKVAQDFPRSDKAPDALLRTAESMLALDLKDDAKKLFEGVVSRYPKSSAAQRARARLAELAPPPA